MKKWTAAAVALATLISLSAARDASAALPASTPSTQPNAADARASATTRPAPAAADVAQAAADRTSAATRPAALATKMPTTLPSVASAAAAAAAAPSHFPTPAELAEKMKKARDAQPKLPKIAYFDLSRPIAEKPADFSLFGGGDETATTLHSLLERIGRAKDDKDVRAVLITLQNAGLNLSQAQEVRDALTGLRRAGKRTFVYADAYDTAGYVAASGATDVCMLGGGEIEMPGVGLETMFAKGLLDKLGVDANYVQIGEYKGADEQFTRTEPSEELRGELDKLVDSLYNSIVDTISLNRNLSREEVKQLIDNALIPAKVAKARGLVDHLVDIDGLRDLMAGEIGEKADLVPNYGKAPREQVDLSSPFAFFALLAKHPEPTTRPGVALIYAEGVIVDGPSGGGLLDTGGNIGSEDMRAALRTAGRDDKIKAVVIRIDSPGGSALASEVMWQAVRRVEKTKPVYISVGSMAASGGYYLASAGDTIYADPTAIVGSIGVVGGKFVMKGLFDKLGISTAAFTRGRNADLFSSNTPWTEGQKRMVTNWMHDTYDQFTERVMTTRTGKIKDIDQVARGRIFMAKQAKDLGMVDEIGGVRDAIAAAADQADLKPGEYDVRVIPAPKTLADLFNGGGGGGSDGDDARLPVAPRVEVSPGSILRVLPAATRQLLAQQVQMLQLLQDRPVMLVSPYVVRLK